MEDMTGYILVPRGNVQDMFDIILESLDFGSGFLDREQIEMLRSTAELLGVDPVNATPRDIGKNYPHKFESTVAGHCKWCTAAADHSCHMNVKPT